MYIVLNTEIPVYNIIRKFWNLHIFLSRVQPNEERKKIIFFIVQINSFLKVEIIEWGKLKTLELNNIHTTDFL